jgi:hypothetical protein
MTRWLETDLASNQNISSPLAVGVYTADTDRLVVVQLLATQVAGAGDYVFYATLTVSGIAYVMLPKTTGTAAAGETNIGAQSILVAVRNGDILTVYIDGLLGDTVTPDTTVRFFELAALRPTTADRTLDVAATGEAGIDLQNILQAAVPTTLTNITVPVVTDVTNNVGLDFTSITQAIVPTTLTNITVPIVTTLTNDAGVDEGAIADAVWNEALAGHLGAGSTGEALDTAASLVATVFPSGAVDFTYTVTNSVTLLPIEGVEVWFSTDNPAVNIVWKGDTDAFGVARDVLGNLPALDVGAYFVWRQKAGFTFADPDLENVS